MDPPNETHRRIASALITWWQVNRREFPWRSWTDLYRLLVAEILLRQTRDETVAAFIPALLDEYPDPKRLSSADEEELATTLRPLGFSHQRAAQLRRMADQLVRGPTVRSHDELLSLAG